MRPGVGCGQRSQKPVGRAGAVAAPSRRLGPVYVRVLPALPVALADPFFRLALAHAARAGLDLFPPPRPGA